jgi:hypothetical protein
MFFREVTCPFNAHVLASCSEPVGHNSGTATTRPRGLLPNRRWFLNSPYARFNADTRDLSQVRRNVFLYPFELAITQRQLPKNFPCGAGGESDPYGSRPFQRFGVAAAASASCLPCCYGIRRHRSRNRQALGRPKRPALMWPARVAAKAQYSAATALSEPNPAGNPP